MCIFCKIVNKEINSNIIYEDEIILAFLDINPDTNGHTLIIPKKHYQDIDDIDDDTFNYILKKAKEIKRLLEKKLKYDGITLVQNNGDIQEIKHFHLHLKPYYNKKEVKTVEEIFNLF